MMTFANQGGQSNIVPVPNQKSYCLFTFQQGLNLTILDIAKDFHYYIAGACLPL